MIWKFTCYNGTVFDAGMCSLTVAIQKFKKNTGLSEVDIKLVENLS